jgi:PPOX class probable F420-dependent enzyme
MGGMTDFPDSHRDLLDAPVAALATIGGDGVPQSTLIWFLHEDGELKLSLASSRLKTKHLMKRPQCSLLILDPDSQFRYLEVRGEARIEPDDDYVFASRVGAKYGADLRQYDHPGETRVMVTLVPKRVYPVDMRQ